MGAGHQAAPTCNPNKTSRTPQTELLRPREVNCRPGNSFSLNYGKQSNNEQSNRHAHRSHTNKS